MAFSYDPSLPLGRVRLLAGDTVSGTARLTDADVQALFAMRGWVYTDATLTRAALMLVAADAADAISAGYSQQADTTNGALSVGASRRAEAFADRARNLRARAASEGAPSFFAGGLTIAGKDDLASDSDAVQPAFARGMDDLPGAPDDGTDEDDD